MRIKESVCREIIGSLGGGANETGGILGRKGSLICRFQADKGEESCPCFYRPNVDFLNEVLDIWEEEGIVFCGVVHSHPDGSPLLSPADLRYAQAVVQAMPDISPILFPLVTKSEGEIDIAFFDMTDGGKRIEPERV